MRLAPLLLSFALFANEWSPVGLRSRRSRLPIRRAFQRKPRTGVWASFRPSTLDR